MRADIDIDVPDRQQLLELIQHVPARQSMDPPRRHNSGIYVSAIPYDAINDMAALDYQTAEDRGYFKLDILNMSVYSLIKSPEHYQEMLNQPPNWSRLWLFPEWASQLVHVGQYTDLLQQMRPDSIPRMAAFISIIRPGKAHLRNKPWAEVFESVWDGDASQGYMFKKSHAISYSALVALHMNLIDPAYQSD